MNLARKKRLAVIREELAFLIDEEQAALDNLPENFQNGAQGERMQEVIEAMENAASELEGMDE